MLLSSLVRFLFFFFFFACNVVVVVFVEPDDAITATSDDLLDRFVVEDESDFISVRLAARGGREPDGMKRAGNRSGRWCGVEKSKP